MKIWKIVLAVIFLALLGYHGMVLKAKEVYRARLMDAYERKQIPQEYEAKMKKNSYAERFFDFAGAIKSLD